MMGKRLYRSCDDRILGGVAAGVAEYFNFDPGITRLIFGIIMVTTGFGFLGYLIAWIVIPLNPKCDMDKTGAEEIRDQTEKIASDIKLAARKKSLNNSGIDTWVGVLIVLLGLLFLIQNIFDVHAFRLFWPVWLIAMGIIILVSSISNDKR